MKGTNMNGKEPTIKELKAIRDRIQALIDELESNEPKASALARPRPGIGGDGDPPGT